MSSNKSKWLIDLGLAFFYSVLMVVCFFLLITYGGWILLSAVLSGFSLVSLCISCVFHSLSRTIKILFVGSFLGVVPTLAIITFYVYHYETYPTYAVNWEWEKTKQFATYLTMYFGFIILVLVPSVLGAITGEYIAEKRKW